MADQTMQNEKIAEKDINAKKSPLEELSENYEAEIVLAPE